MPALPGETFTQQKHIRCQPNECSKMHNMVSSLLLLALLILPSTQEVTLEGVNTWLGAWKSRSFAQHVFMEASLERVEAEAVDIKEQLADSLLQSTDIRELLTIVGVTQNATSQLLAELDTLRGRQAVSAAVQVCQVLIFVAYLLTILTIYFVKRCQKVREKSQRKEFELLEKKLLSNKAKRRAAAAKAKSAPAPSQE